MKTIILQISEVETTGGLIRDILGSPAGSFASVLGIMILAGWLIYFITKHATRYRCDSYADRENVRVVQTNINEMRKDISYLRGSIDLVNINEIRKDVAYLKGTFDLLHSKNSIRVPVQSHSPIGLNDLGNSIAKELNLHDMINRNWRIIYEYLEKEVTSKNAYDIQQICIETASVALNNLFAEDDINRIKDYAFKNGQSLFYYGSVIGVMIRDKYFEAKGINISEIDHHDPQKATSK